MQNLLTSAVVSCAATLCIAATQPAQVLPAPAPKGAAALPPVLDPHRGPVDRKDLIQRFAPSHPIQGFYRLTAMQAPNQGMVGKAQGCLFVGRRHVVLMLYAPGPHKGQAHVLSALRTYRIEGKQLHMSSRVGFRNDRSGELAFEAAGSRHKLSFDLIGPKLRLMRHSREFLDFERVE